MFNYVRLTTSFFFCDRVSVFDVCDQFVSDEIQRPLSAAQQRSSEAGIRVLDAAAGTTRKP
jgi:hypothetical protein